jgi:hypothetical protein
MKGKMVLILSIVLMAMVVGCSKNDGTSASGGRIQYDPESDFEAHHIDGGKGVEITRYLGSKWEINIPPQIQGIPVTHIGGPTYYHPGSFAAKNLLSVTIPNSVTTIGDYAFYDNQLTSVTIPNSVTSIGTCAFANNQLTSVTIPSNTYIGFLAFDGRELFSITIGANVTIANNAVFSTGFERFYNDNGKAAGTYIAEEVDDSINPQWKKIK